MKSIQPKELREITLTLILLEFWLNKHPELYEKKESREDIGKILSDITHTLVQKCNIGEDEIEAYFDKLFLRYEG